MFESLPHHIHLEHLARLLIAGFLGGCIGFERERRGQAAGFRTNILVAIGACLMMQLSLYMEELFRHLDAQAVVRLDPGRIASYAIASIGFVGGGAIIKGKGSVRGLTTAAGLWLVTGIGLAVGAGLILPAIMATAIIMAVLFLLPVVMRRMPPKNILVILTVVFRKNVQMHNELLKIIEECKSFSSHTVGFEVDACSSVTTYKFRLVGRENAGWVELYEKLRSLDGVCKVGIEESPIP
ncbi:MgtC/SapB family protein [Desulfovibrio mangrovi]|uniref:MgtC/SapB family protein n=1 Tax=Desulfovibrio mangrovi TaxID=2976983 RepID=UPI00224748FF|nr:MgtC/SapB family protein [Desulfovibrio mangrovi]UZP68035.1 MgtC/SapB family protein [Desulfovibrio mangrovi]